MSELANKLRALRKQHGMTLDDLAEKTGLSKPYLSDIELGRRARFDTALATLNKILAVYGLELSVEIRSREG